MSFKFLTLCPSCNSSDLEFINNKKYLCKDCSFTYFQNVAAAVAVIIECKGRILLIRRNIEPASGKLDLPGGFVDSGENLEQAAKREVYEELKIKIENIEYFGSYSNIYQYKKISYYTSDAVFLAKLENINMQDFNHEVSELLLLSHSEIDLSLIGFESMKNAVSDYIKTR